MKISEVEIFSPNEEECIRKVEFNENDLSIIYGNIEMPTEKKATSNSIGKTVLLKIVNVILGANNSGKDTIKGLNDYRIKAKVKQKDRIHNVKLIIGNSKGYYVDDVKMPISKYKEYFEIDRGKFSKQIMLEKRKGMISSMAAKATKEDYSTILKLLYLGEIDKKFKEIKQRQDQIALLKKYKNEFKVSSESLEQKKFNLEMENKKISDEIKELNTRINNLKIADDITDVVEERTELDREIKDLAEKSKLNKIKIKKYNEIISEWSKNNISLDDVEKIYNRANIEVPTMVTRKLEDVEAFYKNLIDDKSKIYTEQIENLKEINEKINKEIEGKKVRLDSLSSIISENVSFKEAMKIYNLKTDEKMKIENQISEINGKLEEISNTQEIKSEIENLRTELYTEFKKSEEKINDYREFVYEIVNKVYGENMEPYLSISMTESNNKYTAMPVKIELNLKGDTGEGITAIKNLIFDCLIFKYNKEVEFLIEDSACFEGIDRRQVRKILDIMEEISTEEKKQLIVSLNKYELEDADIKDFEKYIKVKLSENVTLLHREF